MCRLGLHNMYFAETHTNRYEQEDNKCLIVCHSKLKCIYCQKTYLVTQRQTLKDIFLDDKPILSRVKGYLDSLEQYINTATKEELLQVFKKSPDSKFYKFLEKSILGFDIKEAENE